MKKPPLFSNIFSSLPTWKCLGALAGLALVLWPSTSRAQLLLQLQAADYNPVTGTWIADFGSNATQTNELFRPTLVPGLTPNGSAAVRFTPSGRDAGDFFDLITSIPAGLSAFTVFVYLRPDDISGASGGTIFAGTAGSFHYRLSDEKQDIVRQAQADLGAGTTALSTTAFNSINATTSTTGGTYRLNSAANGASSANVGGFTDPISRIGAHANFFPGEAFSGDIAEIRIYGGVMTDLERETIEQEFIATYVTPIPEPGTLAMLFLGAGVVFLAWRRSSQRAV